MFYSPYSERGMRDYKLDEAGRYSKENLKFCISTYKSNLNSVKEDIDKAVEKSSSNNVYINHIKLSGYEIRHGDTYSIKPKDNELIKETVLGDGHSFSSIKERIENNKIIYKDKQEDLTKIFDKKYSLSDQIKVMDFEISNGLEKGELVKAYYELKPIIERGKKVLFHDKYKEKT